MCNPVKDNRDACWPIAAASRIRVKVGDGDDGTSFCRLFHNSSTGAIELVPYEANNDERRSVYDDSDANIEDEPTYQSYLATMKDENRVVLDSFHPDDVTGANLSLEYNINNPNTFLGMANYAFAKFGIYSYPKQSKKGKCNKRKANHRHYALDSRCCEDFADARSIIQSIRKLAKLCNVQNKSPLKCLVVLNPFSGGGGESSKTGAKYVYSNIVKPMLEEAGVEHDALVTQRAGHARERMLLLDEAARKSNENELQKNENDDEAEKQSTSINTDMEIKDISQYDAIVAMGGDGILFEIFQGIHARSDEETILSKMKFGIIACGTCNGLVKSILHWSGCEYDHVESLFQICKGHTSTLDLATYTTASNSKSYVSFLSYTWALIADVDYESECLRWLGSLRIDAWAVYRGILNQKRYPGKFSYLPPSGNGGGTNGTTTEVVMPKVGKPLPEGWISIEDDFMVFWVCNTSHASYDVFSCPMAKMNDGLFHVLIVRSSCSRLRLAEILLKLESGKHIDCKAMEVIDCIAYQFEPLSDVSYNVLDGELLEDGPIQARIMPRGAQFFSG